MSYNHEYRAIFSLLSVCEHYLRKTNREDFADRLVRFREDLVEDRAVERKRSKLVQCAHEGCEEVILPMKKNGLCNAHETYWCTGCKALIPAEQLYGYGYWSKKKIAGATYKLVNRCRKCHT